MNNLNKGILHVLWTTCASTVKKWILYSVTILSCSNTCLKHCGFWKHMELYTEMSSVSAQYCMLYSYNDSYDYVNCLHIYIASNILVQQNCSCTSPLRCKCPGNGGVLYVLGDLDLLCLEDDTSASVCTCEVWNKMVQRDPAGTVGMKPPEVCVWVRVRPMAFYGYSDIQANNAQYSLFLIANPIMNLTLLMSSVQAKESIAS